MSSPSRSGAFEVDVEKSVEKFTESISFDFQLYRQDIAGSIAHAKMLAAQDIISAEESNQIIQNLREIETEITSGNFEFRAEFEDVHMNIEHALIQRIGDVGRKLHTGRSRNDQVSTDQRLWIRDQIDQLDGLLRELQKSLVDFAVREKSTIIPAYTHLQRAQPVLAAHYFLAFCEKFQRDRDRLADCRKRVNQCSLGTAALAGTSLNIDRQWVANELGFQGIVANSLDSSSDRDYVIEYVFCLTLVATHLSTLAEDWIIWATTEFDFIELPQPFCTGSSIMPQKINPDVLELIRGKTARVVGALQTLLILTKGLPMSYNRDLQEDKPALFDANDTVQSCVELAAQVVSGSRLKSQSIASGIERGYLDATTLMEHLIKKGMPQRKAHHLIGKVVRYAMRHSQPLSEISIEQYQELDAEFDESIYEILGVENAVAAFTSDGSTAPDSVASAIEHWKSALM